MNTTTRESAHSVIADLEKKGYEQAAKAAPVILTAKDSAKVEEAGQTLIRFMTDGSKEFEERTGRPMTYAEMRAAWG